MQPTAPPAPFAALCTGLLSQGAEACVYGCTYLGLPCVVKHRLSKSYRHPVLDERLCRERLQGESRATARARRLGIPVPAVYLTDAASGCLVLERIAGPTAKAWLQAGGAGGPYALAVAGHIGCTIARLHASGIAHGDLTTSNVMLRGSSSAGSWEERAAAPEAWGVAGAGSSSSSSAGGLDPADEVLEEEGGQEAGQAAAGAGEEELLLGLSGIGTGSSGGGGGEAEVAAAPTSASPPLPPLPPAVTECVLIDFGLACQNASLEDMGVDLYVLERALNSAHAREATVVFAAILAAYTAHLTAIAPKNHHGAAAVAAKFAAVRMRGRKRVAFG